MNDIRNPNFKQVQSLEDVETLRLLRNQCKQFMTRNNKVISKREQISWWNLNKNKYLIFLHYQQSNGSKLDPIGYGLIQIIENDYYLTGCLKIESRGKGLGTHIFSHLIDYLINDLRVGKNRIKLEVKSDNTTALRLYKKLGFIVISDIDGILRMQLGGK